MGRSLYNPDQVQELQYKLSSILEQGQKKVIIDLEKVRYISSPFDGVLFDYHTKFKQNGSSLKLANPRKKVQERLVITKLNTLVEVYDSLQAALDSFKK